LIAARNRGIEIRVFLDKDKANKKVAKMLKDHKVKVAYDSTKSGLMHNKFAVIDKKIVLSGSYNWTYEAEKENRENLIILPYIKGFSDEFDRMWSGVSWRLRPIRGPPGKSYISVFFSPKGGCEDALLELIRSAKNKKLSSPAGPCSICTALYYFTRHSYHL